MGLIQRVVEAIARRRVAFEYMPVDWPWYRKKIDAGLVGGRAAAIAAVGVRPVAVDASGGYLMEWRRGPIADCVVYVGSQGERYVAARDERELVAVLPYGPRLHDAMKYVSFAARHRALDWDLGPFQRAALDDKAAPIAAEIEAHGVALAPDVLEVVKVANGELLASWLRECETLDRLD